MSCSVYFAVVYMFVFTIIFCIWGVCYSPWCVGVVIVILNIVGVITDLLLLNQAHAWFLEIALVHDVSMHVCVCMCLPPRL